jgi:hypothetical protein
MRPGLFVAVLLATAASAAERPRLGVFLVIDQLSAEAFRARLPLATQGIKRLATEGHLFYEARYEAAPTITSVGHATLMTGAYGAVHGITGNEWIETETGTPRLSTEDPAYQVLGRDPHPRDGTAPTWLRAPTLADAVRAHHDKAMAVAISAKDRSAILCAGRAGLAIWFDAERPIFTTSTFYAKELPPFVAPVNQRIAEAVVKGAFRWGLPAGGIDGKAPQLPKGRVGDSEPFAEALEIQQPLDTAEVDVALSAVEQLGLGKDEVPDLLVISFSAHDRIGHHFGPDSKESLDDFLHLDREIGRLLTELDRRVGRGKYVVALSSDHGVPPVPEVAKARGLDAGRVDMKALRELLDAELDAALGKQDWFVGSKTPGFTLAPMLRLKALTQLERLRKVARAQPGVLDLFSSAALDLADPAQLMFRRGYVPGRTPDLIVLTRPYWTYGTWDLTGHASPYLYDRAVPLVFFGGPIKKGQSGVAEVIDAAPTLSRLLDVPAPAASQGRPLDAVFR